MAAAAGYRQAISPIPLTAGPLPRDAILPGRRDDFRQGWRSRAMN